MEDFRIGDIVRIRGNKLHSELRPIDYRPLIFEITDIDVERVKLDRHSDFIPISDIEGVPVNGVDDADIYYDPVIMASTLNYNGPTPVHRTDYTYFMEAFERCSFEGTSFKDLLAPYEFKTVHEIQHFLYDKGFKAAAQGLEVNYRISNI